MKALDISRKATTMMRRAKLAARATSKEVAMITKITLSAMIPNIHWLVHEPTHTHNRNHNGWVYACTDSVALKPGPQLWVMLSAERRVMSASSLIQATRTTTIATNRTARKRKSERTRVSPNTAREHRRAGRWNCY